jgi:hypothetical protein
VLEGFEWNDRRHFAQNYKAGVKIDIDRDAGVVKVRIPALTPKKHLMMQAGATHVQLVAFMHVAEFDKKRCVPIVSEGKVLSLGSRQLAAQVLECVVGTGEKGALIVSVMLRAFQDVKGVMKEFKSGDAMMVVKVENQVG